MRDPRAILDDIIERIDLDIKELKETPGKLSSESALDLVRYSKAILDIVNDQDEVVKNKRATLSKMSTEELVALAKATVFKKEEKKPEWTPQDSPWF